MNKILTGALLLLFSSSAAAQTPRDSIGIRHAQGARPTSAAAPNAAYAQIDMFGSRQSISVATYPGRRFTTSIVHLDRRASPRAIWGRPPARRSPSTAATSTSKPSNRSPSSCSTGRSWDAPPPRRHSAPTASSPSRTARAAGWRSSRATRRSMPIVARRYRSALAAGPVLIDGGNGCRIHLPEPFLHAPPPGRCQATADGTV